MACSIPLQSPINHGMCSGSTATCPISMVEFHGRSTGTQQHFKGRGLNVPDLHLVSFMKIALQLIGLLEKFSDMYICIYMEKYKYINIYIYIYMWKTTIYIYTENMFMEIYHMYIYIHIYIQDNIQKKKRRMSWKKTIVSNIDQFRQKPIHWLLRETYQIYPPVSSNGVYWKFSHLVQCVFQL